MFNFQFVLFMLCVFARAGNLTVSMDCSVKFRIYFDVYKKFENCCTQNIFF